MAVTTGLPSPGFICSEDPCETEEVSVCMVGFANFDAIPSWFVALADCEAANPVGRVLRDQATQEVRHPSGRPWLLGRWAAGTLTTGRARVRRARGSPGGDSSSTSPVSHARGPEAVGSVTCGFYDHLVTAHARCCPSFARRLRTQHGPRGFGRVGTWTLWRRDPPR